MHPVPGNSIISATSVFSSFKWPSPLSSPTLVWVASSVVALVWAFQQHGWSYCIPCVIFVARKIAGLPFAELGVHAKQGMRACASLFLSPFATPDRPVTLAPRVGPQH
jgi:hypothetical protein